MSAPAARIDRPAGAVVELHRRHIGEQDEAGGLDTFSEQGSRQILVDDCIDTGEVTAVVEEDGNAATTGSDDEHASVQEPLDGVQLDGGESTRAQRQRGRAGVEDEGLHQPGQAQSRTSGRSSPVSRVQVR